MSMQDPIADLLTRIRNANRVSRRYVFVPEEQDRLSASWAC